MQRYRRLSTLPARPEAVFAWHETPGAFERLCPPWQRIEILERPASLRDGERAVFRVKVGPFFRRWVAEHRDYVAGRQFRDVQLRGPFSHWDHTHRMEPSQAGGCELIDEIEYALPFGFLGRWFGSGMARGQLERMFAYRHTTTAQDLRLHAATKGVSMKILVTGASGLIGSALCAFLSGGGHSVSRLVRREPGAETDIRWDPGAGTLDAASLEGFDAVVHLAGENVGDGRWTKAKKERIRASRVDGTDLLVRTLVGLNERPKVLVCASAVGYYGDRGDDVLTEDSAAGNGFLAEVCQAWEAATEPAVQAGIRVANPRFGVVLSPAGGALKKMLTPFKMGVGGRLGSGRQYMPWIAIDDAVGAIHHAIVSEAVAGPVNVVAPQAVTNLEYTKTLGRVLGRPTILPMPAFAARLAFGEMADALLLASTRAEPKRLADTGYHFLQPELEGALRRVLGKTTATE